MGSLAMPLMLVLKYGKLKECTVPVTWASTHLPGYHTKITILYSCCVPVHRYMYTCTCTPLKTFEVKCEINQENVFF